MFRKQKSNYKRRISFLRMSLEYFKRRFLTTNFFAQHEVLTIFRHIVMFCQCGPKTIEEPESGSRLRVTREINLNDKHLSQYFSKCKVLLMTLEQLFKILIKVPMFDCM